LPYSPAEQDCRRQYTLSVWGDFFLTYQPCTTEELLSMEKKAQARKEEVRWILLDAGTSDDLARKLDHVDELERLGVDYQYKDTHELLCAVYHDKDGGSSDLYVTLLRFYPLHENVFQVTWH
ncbi:hypothetical protein BAE44_0006010, partial [Dichanthelium oligosanthes]